VAVDWVAVTVAVAVVRWTVDSGSWQVAKWTVAMAVAVAVSLSMLYHISFHIKINQKPIFIYTKPQKNQSSYKKNKKKSIFI
jgi:putative ubiquitin-RnfH superfamily antitoxin RatB of RatAB toxin-antitoxin module